jgi:putative tricarboxylic transport membrane protein
MGRNALRDGDVISGAFLAALGVYIFVQAREWDYMSPDGPGPGFFPTWYGAAIVALSLAMIVNKIRKSAPERVDWRSSGRALGTWLAFAAAAALMAPLGFLLSFGLLTFFVVAVVFGRPLATAATTAVCAALGFYLVFPLALNVPLPTGYFGF